MNFINSFIKKVLLNKLDLIGKYNLSDLKVDAQSFTSGFANGFVQGFMFSSTIIIVLLIIFLISLTFNIIQL